MHAFHVARVPRRALDGRAAHAQVRSQPAPLASLLEHGPRGLAVRVHAAGLRGRGVSVGPRASRGRVRRRFEVICVRSSSGAVGVHGVLERLERRAEALAVRDFQLVPEIARRVVVNLVEHVRPARAGVILHQPQVRHRREVGLGPERPPVVVARRGRHLDCAARRARRAMRRKSTMAKRKNKEPNAFRRFGASDGKWQ